MIKVLKNFQSNCFLGVLFIVSFFGLPSLVVIAQDTSSVEVTVEVTCPNNICATGGCTDSSANNYSATAGFDDGSCEYNPIVNSPIAGCTDTAANNFNVNATVDNGSCRYSVPNVLNFQAQKNGTGVRLSWTLPVFDRMQAVIIIRSDSGIPTGLGDGAVIYNGLGTSVQDPDIVLGADYYYLALVRSIDGNYSSGSLVNYSAPEIVEPEPVVDPASPDPGGGGGRRRGIIAVEPVSVFEQLPVATSSSEVVVSELFKVLQPGEKNKLFNDGSFLKVRGNKQITISVDYEKMPEVLKTIGITLYNVKDPDLQLSFLLRVNKEQTAYEATIGPLPEDGVYSISVYLINYDDQTIRKYSGQLAVVGSAGLSGIDDLVKEAAGPVAVTAGVSAGFLQLLFASGHAVSFSDIYLLLLRQLGALLSLLGLKKKNRPWGTVYDSVTKRPIDPAYVTVLANNQEIATAITDIDGRYGFSLLDGDYHLKAAKTHYVFPSTRLAGSTQDEMYNNLYFGDLFHASAGEVISKNIPLDPVGFDWNEFVKGKGGYFRLFEKNELLRTRIISYVYRLGFAMSLFYLLFYPSVVNILVPVLYLGINIFGRHWIKKHRVVTIKNALTGEPISFGIIRVYYADSEQEIKKVVTDMVGRFYLLVRPGTYYLTVDHKQPDGTYARIYKSPVKELKKGVWEENILV